ncbi:unnamed protein product (macronuclear) [Paramecium tetraurelia]|uniref:Uncharacterized protein n=1 Tax=Paramecium tetraurelia TaxID=5888 RepID=A0CZQ1_PARTE|nr:uncharacterized protein GSPATT00011841001 [Paramecium tetraurelia]CAK76268.1 unnamed protein product [Paramecium tetraurelia]|eukprot:XP_001443665.1 hypothetical protein (macronuclear) [Paramecium tetraurelia strain d4-2]
MNKIIILSLMTACSIAYNLNYYRACQKAACAVPYQYCQNKPACQQTFKTCEECIEDNCLEACIFSSYSLDVQYLARCSLNNKCTSSFKSHKDITCPNSCQEPAKLGNEACSTPKTYATTECISDFLIQIGRDECAGEDCVCKILPALDIYIVGCYC